MIKLATKVNSKISKNFQIFLILILSYTCTVKAASITATQTHLQQLTTKISALKQSISTQTHNLESLHQTLDATEKNLEKTNQQLQILRKTIDTKQQHIAEIESHISLLQNQLILLQKRLAAIIRARYSINSNTQLQWRLTPTHNAKNHYIQHAFYYVMQDTQQLIKRIEENQQHLLTEKQTLQHELMAQNKLQQQYLNLQNNLAKQQTSSTQKLTSMGKSIQDLKKNLTNYEQDHSHLTQLLHKLSTQSVIQTKHSFTHMQKKLPAPLHAPYKKPTHYHQGLIFTAPIDTPVYAIFPGKIVFANWLNGYGFLIIIDHGWGYMSLYANNKSLSAHLGDIVSEKTPISFVGQTGTLKQSGLYFEIRHHGKPISPRAWLLT